MVDQSAPVTLACRGCGTEFRETVGRLGADVEVACPGCGRAIEAAGVAAAVALVEAKWEEARRGVEEAFRRGP